MPLIIFHHLLPPLVIILERRPDFFLSRDILKATTPYINEDIASRRWRCEGRRDTFFLWGEKPSSMDARVCIKRRNSGVDICSNFGQFSRCKTPKYTPSKIKEYIFLTPANPQNECQNKISFLFLWVWIHVERKATPMPETFQGFPTAPWCILWVCTIGLKKIMCVLLLPRYAYGIFSVVHSL